jgi:hypothetical protein|tara:strand:+ start:158 stop:457 length:300 start_codon:yes stop_codon:yes gene_type:complete
MANEKVTNVEEQVEEQAIPEAGQDVPESISLVDLQTLLQIVDLASQRGAFRGAEMTQVGAIFDKLNAFLSYVAAQQEANAEANAEEGDSEEAEASAESE